MRAVDVDWLRLALDHDGRQLLKDERVAHEVVSILAAQNSARSSGLHQAGAEVHNVAHDGVLLAVLASDRAAIHVARAVIRHTSRTALLGR